jgi:hypothetical protein
VFRNPAPPDARARAFSCRHGTATSWPPAGAAHRHCGSKCSLIGSAVPCAGRITRLYAEPPLWNLPAPAGTQRNSKLPRYPTTPATLIGRLARAVDHPGMGSLLLADALGRILANTPEVASALVVVDAKDDSAESFYRKHGFIPFGGFARKQFLPIKTIAEAARRSAR